MAIVKGPALSIDASGNLGSICYSKWRGRNIARDAWSGTVPNTSEQQTIQGYLTTLAQYWGGTLTEEERESWRALGREITVPGRLGQLYHPNGYNLFVSRNMFRKRWGLSIAKVPPIETGSMMFDWWEVEYQATGPRIRVRVWEDATTEDAFCCEFWRAGPYDSAGRKPIEPEWKFKNLDLPVGFGWFDYDVVYGKYYWYRFRLGLASGVVMPFQVLSIQAV